MAKNWLWPDRFKEGKKRKRKMLMKAALDRLNTMKGVTQKKRDQGEKGEALARMAGKGIGFFLGGVPGAGVGDLIAGGLYDKMDTSQEANLEQEGYVIDGFDYSDPSATQNINRSLERADEKANTRHLTSPLKSMGQAYMLSSAVLPDGASFGDKLGTSGLDMIKNSKWGQALAAKKATKAADSLNILDIISKGNQKKAAETLLKGGYTQGGIAAAATAAPAINQVVNAPSASSTPIASSEEPLLLQNPKEVPAEVLAKRKAIQNDQIATEEAMELFNKKRKMNRDSMHHYSRIIEGDPSKRSALVEKYSLPELKAMAEGNIDPATGKARHTFIDDVLGGLKKDPKEVIKTPGPLVNGGEDAHQNIENLQNWLDEGGFNVDPNINEANLPNIGPRLNIDESINKLDTMSKAKWDKVMNTNIGEPLPYRRPGNQVSKIMDKPYEPVGKKRLQNFIPNPIKRYDPNNPETWDDSQLERFWQSQKGGSIDPANLNKNYDLDMQLPERNIPVMKRKVTNQVDPIRGYKQEDLGIMGRDLKDRGYSDEQIEKLVREWSQKQYGNSAFTNREYRLGSDYNAYQTWNPDTNQYGFGTIGDEGDWGVSLDPDSATTGQDYVRAQMLTNRSPLTSELVDLSQGEADNLISEIMEGGFEIQRFSTEELYSLYNHGQMEGWTKERLNAIGKLIKAKNKGT